MKERSIFHPELSHAPWQSAQTARLPGTAPIATEDWLTLDAAYAPQMAERARLLAEARGSVLAVLPEARPGVAEIYQTVLAALDERPEFSRDGGVIICPDGRRVALDDGDPLLTLGHLVQEDLCLMEKLPGSDEHVLTAAVLCFPASWTLAEKIGRPLTAIHVPVPQYGAELARRVQRLFDGLRAPEDGGRILMRMNALDHQAPELFQTRSEADPRAQGKGRGGFLRVERQCLRKLPRTGAVVFSIHTTVVPMHTLGAADQEAFSAYADAHRLDGV